MSKKQKDSTILPDEFRIQDPETVRALGDTFDVHCLDPNGFTYHAFISLMLITIKKVLSMREGTVEGTSAYSTAPTPPFGGGNFPPSQGYDGAQRSVSAGPRAEGGGAVARGRRVVVLGGTGYTGTQWLEEWSGVELFSCQIIFSCPSRSFPYCFPAAADEDRYPSPQQLIVEGSGGYAETNAERCESFRAHQSPTPAFDASVTSAADTRCGPAFEEASDCAPGAADLLL